MRRSRPGAGWPLVGSVLIALLAVWTLGTQHAVEHDVRQDGASCAACIAVASGGLVVATVPLPTTELRDERLLPSPNEDAPSFGRTARLGARAPPSLHG